MNLIYGTVKVEVLSLVQGVVALVFNPPGAGDIQGAFPQEIQRAQFENQWREGKRFGFSI